MDRDEDVFRSAILAARNHLERVDEGHALLDQGKPLSEMKTPISGASEELFRKRRQLELEKINDMNEEELRKKLRNIQLQITNAALSHYGGTSELEWQRIMIEERLEKLQA